MPISKHNQRCGRFRANSTVSSLRELFDTTAARMDYTNISRATIKRVELLHDAYLRGGQKTGLLGISRYTALLEAIAQAFPEYCPVLLLWSVRLHLRKRTLASGLVRRFASCGGRAVQDAIREYPWPRCPAFGSTTHRAMAGWFYAYRASQRAARSLRGAVLPTFKSGLRCFATSSLIQFSQCRQLYRPLSRKGL